MEQFGLEFDLVPERRMFTVTEIAAEVRSVLGGEFNDIWVSGEISGLKLATSGHYYFTLKDREAQLRCVAYRSAHRYWKFKPQDGLAVLARGRLDVYEARGDHQLQVEFLEPQGHGALQLAFEQLKKKLAAEGLFEAARKRPLPRFPRRIGIVTSPRGASIPDMLHILTRRFPGLHIRLYPALVQGEGSVEEVCRGIQYFSRTRWADVVIVAAAAVRWKISGRSTRRRWRAPSRPAGAGGLAPSDTRPMSPSPISSPTCARPRPRPRRNWCPNDPAQTSWNKWDAPVPSRCKPSAIDWQ